MPYQQLQIKDIYIGSIDAKDDFKRNNREFIENFVFPKEFDMNEFLSSNKIFIEGLKGTGKTALLYYIKSIVDKENELSDMILFKSDYDDVKRIKLEQQNDKIISIEKNSGTKEKNFTYIWKMIILSKLLVLNEQSNYMLYNKSPELEMLTKYLQAIIKKNKKSPFSKFLKSIKFAKISATTPGFDSSLALEFDWDSICDESNIDEKINECMTIFAYINEKQSPMKANIFIDELEAYYDIENVFKRDLTLIRDLIFTIKEFSEITYSLNKNVKFVCAVRSEMIDAINRHISSKELNKSIYSFRHVLKWNYPNSTAIKHPIFQIWLKRIKNAEIKFNNSFLSDDDLFDKWFDKKINEKDTVDYIIHNTWNKPRDIVRFMQSAKTLNGVKYNQVVFTNLKREYSKESWKEIAEELNATFTKEQINEIRKLFTGFINIFNYKQLLFQAKAIGLIFIEENLENILQTLFRVGVIGNLSMDKKQHRWSHKDDDHLLTSNPNYLMEIHFALKNELAITTVSENSLSYIDAGKIFKCRIDKIFSKRVRVEILDLGIYPTIHVSELNLHKYIEDLSTIFNENDVIYAKVYRDNTRNTNRLERLSDEDAKQYVSKQQAMDMLFEKFGEKRTKQRK